MNSHKISQAVTDAGLHYSKHTELYSLLYDALHKNPSSSIDVACDRQFYSSQYVFGWRERAEQGWTLIERRSDTYIISKRGLLLEVDISKLDEDGRVTLPAIRDRYTPGFSALLSSAPPPADGTRVYFSVSPGRISELGKIIAEEISGYCESYVVKALNDSSEFPRSDALTLYIPDACRESVLKFAASDRIARLLNQHTEPSYFVREVIPGLGWLEGNAYQSGGYERSACVARAVESWQRLADRVKLSSLIENEFEESGIDPEHPYRYLHRSRT